MRRCATVPSGEPTSPGRPPISLMTSRTARCPRCRGSFPTAQIPTIPVTARTRVRRGLPASSMRSAKASIGTVRDRRSYGTIGADSTIRCRRRRRAIRKAALDFRVPMIVVSPYARETSSYQPGYISNTVYEFGSIIQFIEDTFSLGRLGTTDGTTNSMSDMFDFTQVPRSYPSRRFEVLQGVLLAPRTDTYTSRLTLIHAVSKFPSCRRSSRSRWRRAVPA